MALNSIDFWLVFPVIFLVYWLIPLRYEKVRKGWLVLASYLLYMSWKPVFALVLLYVTAVTFFGARSFEKAKSRKMALGWISSLLALAPLVVFKYYNFLNDNLLAGLSAIGLHFKLPGLNWAIPVGLSFFTFQATGYLFDVYRGQYKAENRFFDYLLFVSFFPQITSGPISKASDFMPQIKALRPFSYNQCKQGLQFILWGMFIKLVIADRLGMFVDTVYANYLHYNGTTLFVASLFYSVQIYCDFSGYSLLAIGVGRTLGFTLPDNFRRPYFAVSITDFWRRWHISLTRWLKDNIYIPLGGNRCSKSRCYFNIMMTFLVSGIWHGAAWTFILWGVVHGILQVIEKSTGFVRYDGKNPVVRITRIVITFFVVNFAWIIFRSPDISTAFHYIARIFHGFGVPAVSEMGGAVLLILAVSLSIFFFKEFREEFFPERFAFLESKAFRWCASVLLFCMICLFGVLGGGQFIYVSF